MPLPASCMPRKIPIGDRTVFLKAPTVRQVVEITYVMRNMEDAEDVSLLFELLCGLGWMRCADIGVHLRRYYESDPPGFVRFVSDILLQGYDPKKQTKKSKEDDPLDEGKTVKKPNWSELMADYCRAQHTSYYEEWNNTSFSFFMEMLPEARKEVARRHIHAATENMFAMGGSEELMETWQKQAGIKTKKEALTEKVKDISSEQRQRNQLILNKMMKR